MVSTFVIIPAYNEEKHIVDVINGVKKYCKDIVVVDDGSKDKTYEIAKNTKAFILHHVVNLGKGAAMQTGCEFALKKKAKIIVLIDSDMQHNPKDIPKLLRALKNKDIVFTYRKFNKKMPFVFKLGNSFINKTINFLYGIDLKDSQCGFRAFTAQAYKKIKWKSRGYSVETEMIVNAGKHKLKYAEVPIETIYLNTYKGTTLFDGVKIVRNLLLWKLRK